MSTYQGYLWGPSGQMIYGSPRESPGKYRPRPIVAREIKRSISQYDHAELVTISASLCARIPVLRAAVRDKNSWAFANWIPIYMGENEKWGEAAEEYLTHEVLPNACFKELRQDFVWNVRTSGMGLDMFGDDLAIFSKDADGNPKLIFVPATLIGNGQPGFGWFVSMFSGAWQTAARADGCAVVGEGPYSGLPIYNGIIRRQGRPIAIRVLGYDDQGQVTYNDLPIDAGTHYACEMEFFGQGRGVPRISASILQWMNKEDIDDQFLKGLKNAAERTVIHKIPPHQDAAMARGNAVEEHWTSAEAMDSFGNTKLDENGQPMLEDKAIWVEKTQDGNVTYIGSDEDLIGLDYQQPHPNGEAFAIRVLRECLSDMGWSWSLIDTSESGRAPTRLDTSKANNSIAERQSIQEIRSIRFFQYAIACGMELGRIPRNDAGLDAYRWSVGFPAQMSVDQGNDVTAALNRLKMGLTNERIEAAKEGYISKHINRQREKEASALVERAQRLWLQVQGMGHKEFTFDQSVAMFYQPSPNAPQPMPQQPAKDEKPKPNDL